MLELRNITKDYITGAEKVEALKGVSLQFRKSEFVSILGPSGCGKTTMLNIIGGLDRFTSGDLLINGRSTKEYKDRDWDTYRNHSIGFVFQSYNLIPHQTVLSNVELALTLSGVSKAERKARAKAALERVGLGNQLRKKPGEISGGQCQRVAIARAIVNDPDIILADEPTGALDTETSVQIMEILKDISRERLVIMVTHNPELAETYSTRIVRMLDGRILSDSLPLTEEEIKAAAEADPDTSRQKKPSMSLWTSFGLSIRNLFTKKGRTLLTAFAGSIGIIGIALIYAVSHGATNYIDSVQEETLSSYPLTIESQTMDTASLLSTFMGKATSLEQEKEEGMVYQKAMMYEMMNAFFSTDTRENDLGAFKAYIEAQQADENAPLHKALSGAQYSYDLDLAVYTQNLDGKIIRSDAETILSDVMRQYMGTDMTTMFSMGESFSMNNSMMKTYTSIWREILPGEDGELINPVLKKQYDLVYGHWPETYDEVILFVDDRSELNDMTLYALGLKSDEEVSAVIKAAMSQEPVEYERRGWSYADLCAMDYRVILDAESYLQDEKTGVWTDLRATETGLRYLYDNGLVLHVAGIVRPNKDAVSAEENGHIGYTRLLTDHVIQKAAESPAVKAQKDSPDTDIFTGLPFRSASGSLTDDTAKAASWKTYVATLDNKALAELAKAEAVIPDEETVRQQTEALLAATDRATMEATLITAAQAQMNMSEAMVKGYMATKSDDEIRALYAQAAEEQVRMNYGQEALKKIMLLPEDQLAAMFTAGMSNASDAQCAAMYDRHISFSDANVDGNLIRLGCVDLSVPSGINLYASSFADKDTIVDAIAQYNESVDDLKEIRYTDYVGLIMSSVTTIIDAITYVLIAFVAVSLVVSSIMIGVITLISVQERTKEIGILRAIGASKRNVSSMFTAETVLIGFAAGLLGVCVTWLLCIPINAILHSLTGINTLSAVLPVPFAALLVLISIVLTLIAGIIPSRSAAKKDPVVALRTE